MARLSGSRPGGGEGGPLRAITTEPGRGGTARLEPLAGPPGDGEVLVEAVAVGVCGTDREILRGEVGAPPPGRTRLVLGHESLGRVVDAPASSGLRAGDAVVGIVRRPDPVPCRACAAGEWDLCENGRYVERGIKGLDGFAAERFLARPGELVPVPARLGLAAVLTEPTSVVAKAWRVVDHVARRSTAAPRRVLVTGAGPIGLLAALLGAQRGLAVDVLDRSEDGPKPRLAAALGARYHTGGLEALGREVDVIVECTGAPALVLEAMRSIRPNGVVALAGLSPGRREVCVDAAALNQALVLENNVVFGTVNANRGHYEDAVRALERADPAWLEALLTRRVPLERWEEALEDRTGDVKTVITFGG